MKREDIELGTTIYYEGFDGKQHESKVVENNGSGNTFFDNCISVESEHGGKFYFEPEHIHKRNGQFYYKPKYVVEKTYDLSTQQNEIETNIKWKSVNERPIEDCTILIAIWYDYWKYDAVNYHKDGDYILFFQGDGATMSWDDFVDVGYWWSEFNEPKFGNIN